MRPIIKYALINDSSNVLSYLSKYAAFIIKYALINDSSNSSKCSIFQNVTGFDGFIEFAGNSLRRFSLSIEKVTGVSTFVRLHFHEKVRKMLIYAKNRFRTIMIALRKAFES